MNRRTPASDWLDFMAQQGVKHEPDCPFMAWIEGQDTSRAVCKVLEDAPDEIARQAVMRIYEVARPEGGDKAFWVDLLRRKGAGEGVLRWAAK